MKHSHETLSRGTSVLAYVVPLLAHFGVEHLQWFCRPMAAVHDCSDKASWIDPQPRRPLRHTQCAVPTYVHGVGAVVTCSTSLDEAAATCVGVRPVAAPPGTVCTPLFICARS